MVGFYRERNGDYLYACGVPGRSLLDARVAAIQGHLGSVCTAKVAVAYLRRECVPVAAAAVPAQWKSALVPE